MAKKSQILGIDFGTCRTSAAMLIGNEIRPVPFGSGDDKKDMPTAVFVDAHGKILVGEEAEHSMFAPGVFFESFKPHLARGEIIQAGGVELEYRDLVAAVLERVRLRAQNKLNNDQLISRACITVPTLYMEGGDAWCVMEAAAKQAGFQEVRLIREPHAAAVYYDSLLRNDQSKSDQLTLVYDLGGGTFDPALIQRENGDYRILGAVSGNEGVLCGGIYFDEKIREDFSRKVPGVLEQMRFDPSSEESTGSRRRKFRDIIDLREMLQQAKLRLSDPGVDEFRGYEPTEDREYHLTRSEFESMISPLLDATLDCCDALVRRAGLEWKRIDRILMVGGSCNIPLVRRKLETYAKEHGGGPEICWRRIGTTDRFYDPMLAVSFGAAIGSDQPQKVEWPDYGIPWIPHVRYGVFVDSRDGVKYRTVDIGGKEWFAQNLAYESPGSCAYCNSSENAKIYGRLYSSDSAWVSCPLGWHIPSEDEWMQLDCHAANIQHGNRSKSSFSPRSPLSLLGSTVGWNTGGGDDVVGFRALPSGKRNSFGGYVGLREEASFWVSCSGNASESFPCFYDLEDGVVHQIRNNRTIWLAVRCVRD